MFLNAVMIKIIQFFNYHCVDEYILILVDYFSFVE